MQRFSIGCLGRIEAGLKDFIECLDYCPMGMTTPEALSAISQGSLRRGLRVPTALGLLCVCAGCGTMHHQTSRSAPRTPLEVGRTASMYAAAAWCDDKALPLGPGRVYRIAAGEHVLKVKGSQQRVRRRSGGEKAFRAGAAMAINAGAGTGVSGNVSDTVSTAQDYLATSCFPASAGQAYLFDGFVVLPVE